METVLFGVNPTGLHAIGLDGAGLPTSQSWGSAVTVVAGAQAMTACGGRLYLATKAKALCVRPAWTIDIGFPQIDEVALPSALAAWDGVLYAVTANQVWSRKATLSRSTWEKNGLVAGAVAIAASSGHMYAAGPNCEFWRKAVKDLNDSSKPWETLGVVPATPQALAAWNSRLYLVTTDGGLYLLTVSENTAWSTWSSVVDFSTPTAIAVTQKEA